MLKTEVRQSWTTKEYTAKDKAHLCLKTEVHGLQRSTQQKTRHIYV